MIYGLRALLALLVVYVALGQVTFRLEKKNNRDFVAGVLARAAKGVK